MLFLIGENFDNSEEFNGVVLAVRGRNVKLGNFQNNLFRVIVFL